MNFAEYLRERAESTNRKAEEEKRRANEISADNCAAGLVELIKQSCIEAADSGEMKLSGYIAKRWHGSYDTVIFQFPDGEVYYKPSEKAEYYLMADFGGSFDRVADICLRICEALGELHLNNIAVIPELKKFIRRRRYHSFYSKKPHYKVVSKREGYVIRIEISWQA